MQEVLASYVNIKQSTRVLNKVISGKPAFLNATYRECDTNTMTIINGLHVGPRIAEGQMTGALYKAMIGDQRRGFGAAYGAFDEFPRDPNYLKGGLSRGLDQVIKSAFANYLVGVAQGISVDNARGIFAQLSKESTTKTHIESSPRALNIPERIEDLVRYWSTDLGRVRGITKAEGKITISCDKRRFVDSQERLIKDHEISRDVWASVSFFHKKNYLMNHTTHVTFDHTWRNAEHKVWEMLSRMGEEVEELKKACPIRTDQYPVILSNRATGVLFHEALGGHLISGTYVKDKSSTTYAKHIGRRILPNFISVTDFPPLGRNGEPIFDADGIQSSDLLVVENGVLQSYIHDRDSAGFFRQESNGRARLAWMVDIDDDPIIPEPRGYNLRIESEKSVGEDELFDMMAKHCKRNKLPFGIYLDSHSGEVDIDSGEYKLYPDIAWKVYPSGRRETIANFFVVGNPFELLKQIKLTSNTSEIGYNYCGSESGDVSMKQIAPKVFIPKVTIHAVPPSKLSRPLLYATKNY